MRALITIALTLLAAASIPAGAVATTSHQLHEKPIARAAIIGGTEAKEGTFPWLAYFNDVVELGSGEGGGTCSGTVVATNLVLTAAHCVENPETGTFYKGSGFVVMTGAVKPFSRKTQASSVSRVIVYPGFTRNTDTGDAALLVLSKPTTAPAISLATGPSDSGILEAGTEAMIAGWGRTSNTSPSSAKILQWASTVVQSTEWCGLNASPFDGQDELCAIDSPNDSATACYGDSGGPLLAESPSRTEELEIGVIARSEGIECSPRKPMLFTRADLIASWVHEWINILKPTPPNRPGYYVTRLSKLRKVTIHVAGDGRHIVGLNIKIPLICQHGYEAPSIDESLLSYTNALTIMDHTVRATLNTQAEGVYKSGHINMDLQFTVSGTVKGRLHVDIPTRSKRFGTCGNTLKFTAAI